LGPIPSDGKDEIDIASFDRSLRHASNALRLDSLPLPGHAGQLVLAEWGFVFHAKTLDPLPGEIALEPPVDGGGDAHRDERAEAG
jgi:hypothetical protein